jgi:hypothetical protein
MDQAWSTLRQFEGPATQFWARYLETLGHFLRSRRVLLLASGVGLPWRALAQWPADAREGTSDASEILKVLAGLSDTPVRLDRLDDGGRLLAMRVVQEASQAGQVKAVIVFHEIDPFGQDDLLRQWAEEVSLVPAQYARHSGKAAAAQAVAAPGPETPRTQEQASLAPVSLVRDDDAPVGEPHAERLFQILGLLIDLSRQPRFFLRAYELCNALAVRFNADRVSLGWVKSPYVRLTAISHVEKFDRLSAVSRALEGAMEEAADQGRVMVYPAEPGVRQVQRAHESYALMQGVVTLASVPLMDGQTVVGVVTLEKNQGQWSFDDLWELRLIARATALPLAELRERDRWWGARLWGACRNSLFGSGTGPRNSAWKLAAVLGLIGFTSLFFVPWDYRIDARLTVRSKDMLFVPAPFDGYLRQVNVEIGDKVKTGQVLMQLDTRELVLEESMAQADVLRYSREVEKSQALRQLAEMQIAMARRDQSAARLALIRHQLANANVVAPQDGVVVEGELKKNLGAPLRKGDLLLKLVQTDDIYIELEVDQADVHDVKVGSRGQLALVGRPEQRFSIEIDRIDPASTLREGRNVYLARGQLQEGIAQWWRPGMGGTARIDAGERPLIWVMTHRTVRFLREFFWI